MKKIFMMLLLMMLVFTSAAQVQAAETSGDWAYELSKGDAILTGYLGTDTEVVIPAEIDGYKVVGVGAAIFKNNLTLTAVEFPETLKSIGRYAFEGCKYLKEITLPKKLESIDNFAFKDCTGLERITVESKALSSIEYAGVFGNVGTETEHGTTVIFTENVESIANKMFYQDTYYAGAPNIISVEIGENVVSIGASAFSGCANIENVKLENEGKLETIGAEAFNGCKKVKELVLPENLRNVGKSAFAYWGKLEKIIVNSVELNAFPDYYCAFYGAGQETEHGISVEFSDEVKHVPAYMFLGGDGDGYVCITNVKLGKNIEAIYQGAFYYCFDLKSIDLEEPKALKTLGKEAFYYCNELKEIVLPEALESIGGHTFAGCTEMETIVVKAKELGECTYLGTFGDVGKDVENGTKVIFADSVTWIPEKMFYQDTYYKPIPNITSVEIGRNVTTIYMDAFKNCSYLKEVKVQDYGKLKIIGEGAFANCTALKQVTIPANVDTVHSNAFSGCTSLSVAKVLTVKNDIYKNKYSLGIPGTTVIRGYAGSGAEKYATNYGYAFGALAVTFNDTYVPEFYFTPVMWAVENGVTTGTSPTTFAPNRTCTRGEIITFLYRAMGKPEITNTACDFKDVYESEFYYDAVLWAVENGITTGTSPTTFEPYKTCTRAECLTFVSRALEGTASEGMFSQFVDVYESEFYYKAVLWAVENGITTGTSPTTFEPNKTCTRAECVTFLYRAMLWK